MDNLSIVTYRRNIKAYRTFVAVQIVIQTGIFGNEEGSGNTL